MLMAVPAAVVADQFLFLRTVLREWGFSFAGLAGASLGFWAGTAAGLTIALLLER